MNWTEFYHAVQSHKGKLYDLSIGSPLLLPEISKQLIKAIVDIASIKDIDKKLGDYREHYGIASLIDIFASRCSKEFGTKIQSRNILITPGAQAALFYIQNYINAKNQRILYPLGIEFPGASSSHMNIPSVGVYTHKIISPGIIRPDLNFKSFDWKNVGSVIISRPHNPTGYVLTNEEIKKLAFDAHKHGAFLVIDETYGLPFAPISNNYKSVNILDSIHIYSFSKVGLASERVGIVVGPSSIISVMRASLIRNLVQTPKIGQLLALSIIDFLGKNPELAVKLAKTYRQRWEYCVSVLAKSGAINKGLKITLWQGGGFLWCEWKGGETSDDIFFSLLKSGVAVIPGSCFEINSLNMPRNRAIRVSLGATESDLNNGIKIVAKKFSSL